MLRRFYLSKEELQKIDQVRGRERLPYFQLIIALIGIFSSFWTYLLHIQLKAQAGSPLICDVSETINCSKIIGSSQGEIFGVPLGIWGMVFWFVALALIFLPKFTNASIRYAAFWRLFVASIGFIFALALMYISYFILKGVCEFCSVVQVSCILYFISALISYRKIDKALVHFASFTDFFKFSISVVMAIILPLVIFLATKGFFHQYYKSRAPQQNVAEESSFQAPFLPLLDDKDIDYSIGDDQAPVEIIEFTDFECPYCQLLHERLHELDPLAKEGKIKIYFRNWPLSYHQYARKLAIAARCAGVQGQFWSFADWAFANAKKYARDRAKKGEVFSDKGIEKEISRLSLNVKEFRDCMKDKKVGAKIQRDGADAEQLGGKGTPFLLINGTPYQGNWLKSGQLKEDLLKLINE